MGLYSFASRKLQDRFDTRRLADRIEERIVHDRIDDGDRAFIEARDMFFIATTDEDGQPQCSYKGGEPGFVRVLDDTTIAFPLYDGNGMYLTAGNLLATKKVGLLFIDFEGRKRMRLNGDRVCRRRRSSARRLPRGAAGRARARDRGLPELPALHPRVQTGEAIAVRPEGGVRDAGAAVEAERLGTRRATGGRPGQRSFARGDSARLSLGST